MKGTLAEFHAAHDEAIGRDIDRQATEGRAERAGIDNHEAVRHPPYARVMGVAGQDETSARAVATRERGREARGAAPGGEDAKDAERRPHGVGSEMQGVFEAVRFGLVALGDVRRHVAPDGEARFESLAFGGWSGGQRGGDEAGTLGSIAAPRNDVVEEDIAMRDEDPALGHVDSVYGGEVGVVIPGEDSGWRSGGEKVDDLSPDLSSVRGAGARAAIEGIAIEDEV
jgi:hypothetical protein